MTLTSSPVSCVAGMTRVICVLTGLVSANVVAVGVAYADEAAIAGVLQEQADAWNQGDIEGFMAGYWNDPALRFASGGSVTTGWAETLERYQTAYPDDATMGQLTFSEIDVDMLAPDAALVFGRWRLAREEDNPGGLFSLVFRRLDDGAWVVVHDHTSSE